MRGSDIVAAMSPAFRRHAAKLLKSESADATHLLDLMRNERKVGTALRRQCDSSVAANPNSTGIEGWTVRAMSSLTR